MKRNIERGIVRAHRIEHIGGAGIELRIVDTEMEKLIRARQREHRMRLRAHCFGREQRGCGGDMERLYRVTASLSYPS